MLTYSDMVTYVNLYLRFVQFPAKEEENSGLDREERESGIRGAVQYVLHFLSLGDGMKTALV